MSIVCVNVRVYMCAYVCVHAPPPAVGCLKILEACLSICLYLLGDFVPSGIVCSTIILDSH